MNSMYLHFRRPIIILLFSGILIFTFPIPKAQAMEPVTITMVAIILAPYAIQAAKYIGKGMIRTIPCWYDMGVQLFNILRLPLGLLQSTIGAPFGFFWDGISNMWLGIISPFMLIKDFFCLPLYFFGFM